MRNFGFKHFHPRGFLAVGFLVFGGLLVWAQDGEKPADEAISLPAGLPEIKYPQDNPHAETKVQLGKQLFFDKRLSADDTISCASCHDPAKGWSNGEAVATGVGGQKGGRSAPSIINSAYTKLHFWDGRASSLEDQALGPIQNPIEMKMDLKEVVAKLNKIPGYKKEFQDVFKTDVSSEGIAKAVAAYERTILSGDCALRPL